MAGRAGRGGIAPGVNVGEGFGGAGFGAGSGSLAWAVSAQLAAGADGWDGAAVGAAGAAGALATAAGIVPLASRSQTPAGWSARVAVTSSSAVTSASTAT